jgi:hypothetical protein
LLAISPFFHENVGDFAIFPRHCWRFRQFYTKILAIFSRTELRNRHEK